MQSYTFENTHQSVIDEFWSTRMDIERLMPSLFDLFYHIYHFTSTLSLVLFLLSRWILPPDDPGPVTPIHRSASLTLHLTAHLSCLVYFILSFLFQHFIYLCVYIKSTETLPYLTFIHLVSSSLLCLAYTYFVCVSIVCFSYKDRTVCNCCILCIVLYISSVSCMIVAEYVYNHLFDFYLFIIVVAFRFFYRMNKHGCFVADQNWKVVCVDRILFHIIHM